ncbi:MAG: efflux RND transporter permease subunit, partial [Sphingobacteriales bacterium]
GKVPIAKAAKIAAGEVFLPVFSGTMTTLAPFVPLAFWNSLIGHFMFFLPITLIITLLASLLVAYIINPVFAVDFMKPHIEGEHDHPKFDKATKRVTVVMLAIAVLSYLLHFTTDYKWAGLGNFVLFALGLYLLNHFVLVKIIDKFQKNGWPRFQNWYAGLLEKAVRSPWWILGGVIGLFIFSILFMMARAPKVEFFPEADPNFVYVYVTLPTGTDQEYTDRVTQKLENIVSKTVEPDRDIVSSIISNVTVSVTDPTDEDQGDYPNKGKVTVAFVEFGKRNGKDTKVIMANVREAVKGIVPGAQVTVAQEGGGPPTQKDISIEIVGDDLDSLTKTAVRLKNFLVKQNIPGIEELMPDVQNNKPQIVFDVNRERANREGITSAQITQALAVTVYGAKAADFRNTTEDNYEINVQGKEEQRNDIDAIRNLKITYRDMATGGSIRQVPISAFTDIRYKNTFSNIKHKQQRRVITLSSNVIKGFNANEVNAQILQAVSNFKTPEGMSIRQSGGQEDQVEAMTFLLSALGVSFLMILVILMMQFNSFGKTLIIISEILFSIIGVFLGVSIFGMTITIVMT